MKLREIATAVLAAAGFVSAIVSLLLTPWDQLSRSLRVRRSLLIAALLVAALVAGVLSFPPAPLPSDGTTAKQNALHRPAVTDPGVRRGPDAAGNRPRPAPAPQPPPSQPSVDIRDREGGNVAPLVAAANRVVGMRPFRVEGRLTSDTASETDERLKGMITTRMNLDVTVRSAGKIVAAFAVASKGSDFRATDARESAMDSLATAFEERLRKEFSK